MEEIIKKFQGIGFELDSVKICGATMIRNSEKVYLTETYTDYEKAEGDVPFYNGTDFSIAEKRYHTEDLFKKLSNHEQIPTEIIPF